MQEKNSYFKRTLVVLMAIMMVFTCMPNGMWGGVLKPHGQTQV